MIGIALLGAGRMARVHAKGIGAAGGKLVTVFDVVEKAAASLATETGASVSGSIEEALHHPRVAAVLVATSSDTHVNCIIQASKAGKAVMCEKPLGRNATEAARMTEAVEKAQENVNLLNRTVLTIPQQAGADGRLFGSVTAADVVDAVAEQAKVNLDRRRLHLDEPIKSLGTHEVPVKLHSDVEFRVTVEIYSG